MKRILMLMLVLVMFILGGCSLPFNTSDQLGDDAWPDSQPISDEA